jgi:hypothetical protein
LADCEPEIQKLRDICETVFVDGAAVLMARIVDGAGLRVLRDRVAQITYSIREIDPRYPDKCESVSGHIDVPLEVDRVLSDSLKTGGLWDVDAAGYNFRHEIRATRTCTFPKPGVRYEIRYLFQPNDCGGPVIIRFLMRLQPR